MKTLIAGDLKAREYSHPDQHTERSSMGQFFEPWRCIWKSWAPAKCKVFLWFAIRNRCYAADRLAK
jgi:hypothetical protein